MYPAVTNDCGSQAMPLYTLLLPNPKYLLWNNPIGWKFEGSKYVLLIAEVSFICKAKKKTQFIACP